MRRYYSPLKFARKNPITITKVSNITNPATGGFGFTHITVMMLTSL